MGRDLSPSAALRHIHRSVWTQMSARKLARNGQRRSGIIAWFLPQPLAGLLLFLQLGCIGIRLKDDR